MVLDHIARGRFITDALELLQARWVAAGEPEGLGPPSWSAVYDWRTAGRDGYDQGFHEAFARAHEAGTEYLDREASRIADDGFNDTYESPTGLRTNYDVIQRSKLRWEDRQRRLKVRDPLAHGARLQLANDPKNPVQPANRPLSEYTEPQLLAAFEEAQARRKTEPEGGE